MVSPDQEYIIAVDGLVVIVNPENKLASIGVQDLARIRVLQLEPAWR